MMKKFFRFILVFLLTLTLSGCFLLSNDDKIINVEFDQTSIAKTIELEDFDISELKLIITKANKEIEIITVDASMLSEEDLNSLKTIGNKEIIITYEGFTVNVTFKLVDEMIQPTKVNIFAINDTHGAFYSDSDNVGFEKVNTLIKGLERLEGEYLKIANGDIFQGTYVSNIQRGLPLIDVLNYMNFDAFVIGNHEFDWGIEEIAKFADNDLTNGEANFPFLACNIIETKTGKTLPWTKDYTIVEQNGYKIGIIGAIGETLESSIAADKIQGYEFVDPVPIIDKLAKKLRSELDCNAVVVAIHEYYEKTNNRLASLTGDSRIDAIICGHTHQMISEFITRSDDYRIPVIECSTKNNYGGTIILSFDDSKKVEKAETMLYRLKTYDDDQEILNLIEKYRDIINAGERVVAYTPEYLSRYRLGSEMTNAMKAKYQADVAIINTGGVRGDISTGEIRVLNIFDVFPFDNHLISTTMKGSDLISLYNNNKEYLYFNDDFRPSTIDLNKTYKIITIDYVFTGSYYKKEFANSVGTDTNVIMRDMFIEYLESWPEK